MKAKATDDEHPNLERVLRKQEIYKYIGLKRTQFQELRKNDPTFPRPIKLSDKGSRVVWLPSEIRKWLESRKAIRDADLKRKG